MSLANTLTCLAFSPDGQKIATGTARSGVTVTDISSESEYKLDMLADAHAHVVAVAWSPDSENIMSASLDHTMHCWNATSLHPLGPPFEGHKDLVLAAGFLRDSSRAISLSRDGELFIWDPGSGVINRHVTVSDAAQTIYVVALSIDGTLLVTTGTKEGVAWEIPTCVQTTKIALPDIPLLQAALIPNNRQVVLAFGDKSFWIWDTNTGTHDDARFEGLDEDAIPLAMAVSPDGRFLALDIDGDNDCPIHFYDMKGHEVGNSNVKCTHPFAFSPDGKYFAAASVPSDSKDGSYKLVIRPVEKIFGPSALDVPAVRDKGKQRSPGLDPGFFDQFPRSSGGIKGRTIRNGPGASSSSGHQQAQQQTSPRPASRKRRIPPLRSIWKRIRHPRSHKARSAQQVEVATAQALKRTVVSPPRQKTSTQKDSSQSSSDARANSHPNSGSAGENSTQPSGETGKRLGVSPLRQEESAQKDPAEANQTGQRHDQGHNDEEVLESGDSGIVYMTRDTESVKAHGCWDTFWNWLCYKAF